MGRQTKEDKAAGVKPQGRENIMYFYTTKELKAWVEHESYMQGMTLSIFMNALIIDARAQANKEVTDVSPKRRRRKSSEAP